jgi:hypothetical protein
VTRASASRTNEGALKLTLKSSGVQVSSKFQIKKFIYWESLKPFVVAFHLAWIVCLPSSSPPPFSVH